MAHETAISITEKHLRTLWYENEDGEKHIPSENAGHPSYFPEGFYYQHTQFPNVLRRTCLRGVLRHEVDECEHPEEDVRRTYGWIAGIEGRECVACHGTQTRKVGEPWPDTWDSDGARPVFGGDSSWPPSLVMAMSRPSPLEFAKQLVRNRGRLPKRYSVQEAILIAANNCERCMNALAYRYGLNWGYKEFSPGWLAAGTSCEFCEEWQEAHPFIDRRQCRASSLVAVQP